MGWVIRVARSSLAFDVFKGFVPAVARVPRGQFDSQLRLAIFSTNGTRAESIAAVARRLELVTAGSVSRRQIGLAFAQVTTVRGTEFSAALQARLAHKIPVLYVTNRNVIEGKQVGYGPGRGRGLSYGVAEVSVPEDHRYGSLESPNIWKFEFRENAKRDVVIRSTEPLKDRAAFGRELVQLAEGGPGDALVFVHGYNVTFKDAMRRAGQLAYDLQFDGPVVVFSWPSKGKSDLHSYEADGASAGAAQARFTDLLSWLLRKDDLHAVHLLAHSMGNRLATNSMMTIAPMAHDRELQRLRQVILAAPDVDEDEFVDRAAAFRGVARRVTMYGSKHDKALWASGRIAERVRAGSGGFGLVIAPGVDSVDVSPLTTDFKGHSYYGNNPTVLTDMYQIIQRGTPPDGRARLEEKHNDDNKIYWAFEAGR